ncbi:LysR family transcriptional regulator [Brucella endophytica]|uniref:LysR family transcriptional regulator n=1 Tax=Brucella endophytica TaxID=1963359 RepID=A0A916SHR0_9HYPH|nr:LysR substrate-binding domain-containing protein [Brucella endophytica]GGB01452.1 LysR family transcriptional regulator [Brucella endophytica]
MRPLPSLNALKTFEAVARHRSMTKAAEELCVTHGAVSRQIRSLEETLGVILLTRNARLSDPTPEGARLAEGLASAFSIIEGSIERIEPGPLTLSCSSSIMMEWIIPRIGRFHHRYPNIELQFNMNYDRIDFMRDKISIAIRSSVIEPPAGAITRDLGSEEIGLICAPSYLAQCPLADPGDVTEATVLATQTRPEAFADWKKAADMDFQSPEPKSTFHHFYLLIQAMLCGLGVAAVPHMLVAEHIASRRLVAPFGFRPGPRRMVLWIAPHKARQPDILALEKWLIREMRTLPQKQDTL